MNKKIVVITHVLHIRNKGQTYGYGPYVKEMNLWFKHVDEVRVVAPESEAAPDAIDLPYEAQKLTLDRVPAFNLTNWNERLKTLLALPKISYRIFKGMLWADHIHLRCPGNMGLLGAVIQIAFPYKPKTAKYAGNWDLHSKQPWSYNVQKWILSNTFLARNMKVLVYGEWPGQSKNIIPFFTASYSEKEKIEDLSALIGKKLPFSPETKNQKPKTINLIYVGALSPGKRPLLSVQTAHRLLVEGLDVHLDLFGEGSERETLEAYINAHQLDKQIVLHGNQSADMVKAYFQKAHFLIFISKSEGWPKVVAEAMFWGCLPITADVSCVNYMIGGGTRGKITEPNVDDIVKKIKYYLENPDDFQQNSKDAMAWSQQFTLEKFEEEIGRLLYEA